MLGIAKAVSYLHSDKTTKGVQYAHRDLKLQNVLCNPDGTNVKVCDFGFIITDGLDKSYMTSKIVGTRHYMAPELYIKASLRNQ